MKRSCCWLVSWTWTKTNTRLDFSCRSILKSGAGACERLQDIAAFHWAPWLSTRSVNSHKVIECKTSIRENIEVFVWSRRKTRLTEPKTKNRRVEKVQKLQINQFRFLNSAQGKQLSVNLLITNLTRAFKSHKIYQYMHKTTYRFYKPAYINVGEAKLINSRVIMLCGNI